MKKVYLILTDGGGQHRSIAKALQEVIEKRQLGWQIRVVNFYKEIIGNQEEEIYNLLLTRGWTGIYWPLLVPLLKLQIRLFRSNWLALLKRYWLENKPDLVVSLTPFVNRELCESLQTALPGVPFITAICDFIDCSPPYWIDRQEQFLICNTEQAVEQAKALGHQDGRIFRTSGLVIQPRFYEPITVDRRLERQRLGLNPDLPTGLIMFGSRGSKVMLQIAECLRRSPLNLQLIFICGHNKHLASTLASAPRRSPVLVETFTTEIPYYMHLSDFFIGKPGAGNISEAVAMKLPVITECNPSTLLHERYNAEWIANNDVGIVVRSFRNIDQAVAELIQPDNLTRYRANAAALNNRAVFEVVDILQSILEPPYIEACQKRERARCG